MIKIENYIDGKLKSFSKDTADVFNPSTGEVIANVIMSNQEDFRKVIESSKKSQIEWSNYTPLKRSRIISNYKRLIEENINELSKLVSMEHGKNNRRCKRFCN